jgi:hypothetical protein
LFTVVDNLGLFTVVAALIVHNADHWCDAYLERGVDGSFLARPSKGNPGDFTLSGEIVLRRKKECYVFRNLLR